MIFTMDDGPYAGLPHETTVVLPAVESVTLDEHMQLNLAKVERATEPWVFQCVRDGKLQWTRVVSGEPDGQVESATFAEVEPNKTGPYGWHVYFQVDWDFGVEQAHLYVNAKGELICYFLSW
jgi:hypothetical protein